MKMEIAKNQTTKALPYDAEVEWIQNHSAQPTSQYPDRYAGIEYIDLTIPLPDEFKFVFSAKIIISQAYIARFQFFGNNSTTSGGFSLGNYWGAVRANVTGEYYDSTIPLTGKEIEISGVITQLKQEIVISLPDKNILMSSSLLYLPRDASIFLFNNNGNVPSGAQSVVQMQFKHLKITSLDEEQTYIDVIPVRKVGAGYVYDKVSRKMLGSAVSGSFTVGPDVKGAL